MSLRRPSDGPTSLRRRECCSTLVERRPRERVTTPRKRVKLIVVSHVAKAANLTGRTFRDVSQWASSGRHLWDGSVRPFAAGLCRGRPGLQHVSMCMSVLSAGQSGGVVSSTGIALRMCRRILWGARGAGAQAPQVGRARALQCGIEGAVSELWVGRRKGAARRGCGWRGVEGRLKRVRLRAKRTKVPKNWKKRDLPGAKLHTLYGKWEHGAKGSTARKPRKKALGPEPGKGTFRKGAPSKSKTSWRPRSRVEASLKGRGGM